MRLEGNSFADLKHRREWTTEGFAAALVNKRKLANYKAFLDLVRNLEPNL